MKAIIKDGSSCGLCGRVVARNRKIHSGKGRVRHKCSHGRWCYRGNPYRVGDNEPGCRQCFQTMRTKELNRVEGKERAMSQHIPPREPCYGCGAPTTLRFLCPCDLPHPMCERCLNAPEIKKDCAYLFGAPALRAGG